MRSPITYNFAEGQMLYAVLCNIDGAVQVSVEHLNGDHMASWSVSPNGTVLGKHEFIAQTWGDTRGLMTSAMLGTGWFARTGKMAAVPSDESNEIWKVSPLGLEWLSAQRVDRNIGA